MEAVAGRLIVTLHSTIWGTKRSGDPTTPVVVLDRHRDGRLAVFRRIRRLKPGDALLLNGALGAGDFFVDLLFAIYLRFVRREVTVLISDATWHPRTVSRESRASALFALYAFLQKRLLLLCESPRTHYCFLSRNEVTNFTTETGIDPRRVHFTRFCSQLPKEIRDEIVAASYEVPLARTVFAGGNSLRDYETLVAAADGFDARFTIATTNTVARTPPNVTLGPVDHFEFFRIMAKSAVVVVPLLPTDRRSVGQQTYLNALALGKAVVVSDVSGVTDHLVDGEHAIVVPPRDAVALRAALAWVLTPANADAVARMAESGRRLASTRTFDDYYDDLCRLLKDIR